jgi:hypothetical protein
MPAATAFPTVESTVAESQRLAAVEAAEGADLKRSRLAEYAEILRRNSDPEPEDASRLQELRIALGLSIDDVRRDLKDVQRIAKDIARRASEPEHRAARSQATADREAEEKRHTAAMRTIEDAFYAADIKLQTAKNAERCLAQLRADRPWLVVGIDPSSLPPARPATVRQHGNDARYQFDEPSQEHTHG